MLAFWATVGLTYTDMVFLSGWFIVLIVWLGRIEAGIAHQTKVQREDMERLMGKVRKADGGPAPRG